jgi:arginase
MSTKSKKVTIKLIEVDNELGAGTRGASLGIPALKIAALDFGSPFFKRYKSVQVKTQNSLLLDRVNTPFAKRINGIYQVFVNTATEVIKLINEKGTFPVVLAGDHSTAAATIAGIRMADPNKRLGVIWIDAHADIHSPYTTPSGNMHGMPIAISLSEDNQDKRVNYPSQETEEYWEKLKTFGGKEAKIKAEDLIYVGVRDTEEQEKYIMDKLNIRNYTVAEVRRKGIDKCVNEIIQQLLPCDWIYISFDVDSMDPKVSSGTGTPVPGGFSEKEAGRLLSLLVSNEKVCCLEIVEINPTLDKENAMAETAFEILSKVTNQIDQRDN